MVPARAGSQSAEAICRGCLLDLRAMADALMLESGVRGETRRRRIQSLLRGPGLRQAFNDSTPIPCGPLSFGGYNPPVPERPRFPAAPYLATCLLRDSAPPTGGVSFETTSGVEHLRVETGLSDTLWSLRTISLSRRLALRRSDSSRPVESKSSVAKFTAPVGIPRGQAAP